MENTASGNSLSILLLILLLSFSIAVIIIGILIKKFRIFDNKKAKHQSNVSFFIGNLLTALGFIFIIISALLLMMNLYGK